ncbi:hypothetical protein BACFIN_06903 [Bacteroides finegoldii DSM 17565]|nr:hypothetical protein BACFIN_06903 [Bacteroides finegoldii DSM 17565]
MFHKITLLFASAVFCCDIACANIRINFIYEQSFVVYFAFFLANLC